MPVPLDTGDRKILAAAAGLFVALVVAGFLLSPPPSEESRLPSSYSSGSGGARAAFLLLKEFDYAVDHWEQPPTQLPAEAKGVTLILAEPFMPSSVLEREALRNFVKRGGRILATGVNSSFHLEGLWGKRLQTTNCSLQWTTYAAQVPSPLARDAETITMGSPLCWKPPTSGLLGAFGGKETSVVINATYGKGQVILWSASTPLTNAGIVESHNLELFLNSVGNHSSSRILWDEYYHGRQGSLATYIGRTPLLWGVLQLGLIFLVICLTYGRRFGPVRSPAAESRMSPLEYVETVGDLYRFAHAGSAAVETAYQRFRSLAALGMGLPSRPAAEQIYRAATRRMGGPNPEFFKVLQSCEAAVGHPHLDDDRAIFLVQALHDYARLLQLTTLHTEAKRKCQSK